MCFSSTRIICLRGKNDPREEWVFPLGHETFFDADGNAGVSVKYKLVLLHCLEYFSRYFQARWLAVTMKAFIFTAPARP